MEGAIIAGLDIGTTKICAVIGKENRYGKLEIMGMGRSPSYRMKYAGIINVNKTVEAIQQAIQQAESQANVNIRAVNVGIAGHHIRHFVHSNTNLRAERDKVITMEDTQALMHEMYNIVLNPGCQIIHVVPQDYTIDEHSSLPNPIGMTGAKLQANFNIITANTKEIEEITRCVRSTRCETDLLVLEPIASSVSVLTSEEKEAGVCLVDIGGGTTDIAVFSEGIIRRTAVVPMGGQIITEDIRDGCKVMEREAEKLKLTFGVALPESAPVDHLVTVKLPNRSHKEISCRNLALIIHARLKDIIEQVHREILLSGYSDKLSAGIVITGGGALLSGIKQLFEYMTGLETRLGYPNAHLGRCKVEDVKSPMYSTAIGLVLVSFKSIDDREMCYIHSDGVWGKKGETSFMKGIWRKAKDMFIDNFDDKI